MYNMIDMYFALATTDYQHVGKWFYFTQSLFYSLNEVFVYYCNDNEDKIVNDLHMNTQSYFSRVPVFLLEWLHYNVF